MNKRCFGMTRKGCSVLEDGNRCQGCGFYKDRAQYLKDCEIGWARMRELPIERQREYAERYYAGKMPWYDETEVFG